MIEISKLCPKIITRFCLLHLQKFVSNMSTFLFKYKFLPFPTKKLFSLISILSHTSPILYEKKNSQFWDNLVIPFIAVGVNDPIKFQVHGLRP